MSIWKKLRTNFGWSRFGPLTDSLEVHLKIVKSKESIEEILRDFEYSTGYVRADWSESEHRKALSHQNWKVRALAMGHEKFALDSRSFEKALRENEWFPKFVFLSRSDVFLNEQQAASILNEKEDAVSKVVKMRQPEWRAKEEAVRLKEKFGVGVHEDRLRCAGPAL